VANQFKVKNGLVIEGVQGSSTLLDLMVINTTTGLVESRNQLPSSSITNFDTAVSASAAASGFGNFTLVGTGVYSSSTQISNLDVFLEKTGDNVISSSAQVIYSQIDQIPGGIVSSSTQIQGYNLFLSSSNQVLLGNNLISSSQQITNLGFNISSSDQILLGNNLISSSTQISNLGYYKSGSSVILKNINFDGSITASNLSSNGTERTPLVIDGAGNIYVGADYTADTGEGSVTMTAPDTANAILISVASGSKEIQQIDTTADFLGFGIQNLGPILSSNIVSSSAQIQGYDLFLEKTGDNVISSSAQVTYSQISAIPGGIVSSSAQVQGYNLFLSSSDQILLGNNLISSSQQVTDLGFSISSSDQILLGNNLVSSSAQVQGYDLFLEKTGDNVVTSSAQIIYSQISSIPTGIVSSSAQLGLSETDDVNFNSLTVKQIIAEEFIVSSSVTYLTQSFSSGSTKFGDTYDDTHEFSGSVSISGSFALNDSSGNPIFEIGNDGVLKHTSATGTGLTGDTDILSVSRTDYKSLHVTYHLYNNTNTAFRAGMVNYVWDSTTDSYVYTEFTTTDLGTTTSDVEFSGSFDGTNFKSQLKIASGTWNVKMRGNVL